MIANPSFGFLVSESGSGHTWSLNSHENQLTPWSNDPVSDPPGEAIYVRDENTGEVWSPTALPIRDETATYISRHGQGYSRFQHGSHGILLELLQFVASEDPIKISRLVLRNNSGRPRRLSVTAYAEWVLGSSRSASAPYSLRSWIRRQERSSHRSTWGGEFGGRVAFADLAREADLHDRRPHGIYRAQRDARAPCRSGTKPAHFLESQEQVSIHARHCKHPIELRPGAKAEIVFFLGQAENR